LNLNFTPQKKYGDVYYQDAIATSEFWAKWRYNKVQLSDLGICIIPKLDVRKKKYWIVRRVSKFINKEIVPLKLNNPVPLSDTSKLLNYQVPAVSGLMGSMIANGIAIDASDTGTGKTYTALKTCALMGYRPAIICTKSGIYDWKKVCAYYGLDPLFVVNWESSIGRFYKDKNNRFRVAKICQPPNPYLKVHRNEYNGKPEYTWLIPKNKKICIIFDEIHKANGNHSHAQSIVMAAKGYYPIIALSATMADKMEKLRTIGSLIGLFNYASFTDWLRDNHCFQTRPNQWESLNERQEMKKISKLIFPNFGVRICKGDIPGFPDIQNIAKLFSIAKSEMQNKRYKALLIKIDKLKKQNEIAQILVLRLRYRQIAEMYKVPLLADLVNEYIDSGLSVVVFVNFTDTLNRLKKSLHTDCTIYGGQKPEERLDNITKFQADKSHCIVSNIKAGGTGINLHDLNGNRPRIALICPTDDATILKQAMGRIHRAGAKSKAINVLVYSAGTIEEKVCSSVIEKIKNIDTLNDGDLLENNYFKKEK